MPWNSLFQPSSCSSVQSMLSRSYNSNKSALSWLHSGSCRDLSLRSSALGLGVSTASAPGSFTSSRPRGTICLLSALLTLMWQTEVTTCKAQLFSRSVVLSALEECTDTLAVFVHVFKPLFCTTLSQIILISKKKKTNHNFHSVVQSLPCHFSFKVCLWVIMISLYPLHLQSSLVFSQFVWGGWGKC